MNAHSARMQRPEAFVDGRCFGIGLARCSERGMQARLGNLGVSVVKIHSKDREVVAAFAHDLRLAR